MLNYLNSDYRWLTLLTGIIFLVVFITQLKLIVQGYGSNSTFVRRTSGLIPPNKATNAQKISLALNTFAAAVVSIASFVFTFQHR